jgi:hypothetical protein
MLQVSGVVERSINKNRISVVTKQYFRFIYDLDISLVTSDIGEDDQ